MTNKSSKAGHIPLRTCVICKCKAEQKIFLRFVLVDKEIVFDLNRKFPAYGYYVCDKNECLEKIEKWVKRKLSKKINRNGSS